LVVPPSDPELPEEPAGAPEPPPDPPLVPAPLALTLPEPALPPLVAPVALALAVPLLGPVPDETPVEPDAEPPAPPLLPGEPALPDVALPDEVVPPDALVTEDAPPELEQAPTNIIVAAEQTRPPRELRNVMCPPKPSALMRIHIARPRPADATTKNTILASNRAYSGAWPMAPM
jgi:hypothetical protein